VPNLKILQINDAGFLYSFIKFYLQLKNSAKYLTFRLGLLREAMTFDGEILVRSRGHRDLYGSIVDIAPQAVESRPVSSVEPLDFFHENIFFISRQSWAEQFEQTSRVGFFVAGVWSHWRLI